MFIIIHLRYAMTFDQHNLITMSTDSITIIHISYAMTFGTFYNFHFRVNCHKFLPFKREVNYSIDFNFRFRCDPLFLEIKRKHCKFFTNVPTFRVYVNEIEYPFKGTNLPTSHNCSRQEILRLHEINSPLSSMNWSYWI